MSIHLKATGKYIWNICIAVDQLVNTILGGDPDETICSHAAKRMHKSTIWASFAAVMEFLDPGHMQRTAEHDRGKDSIGEYIARKRRERAEREAAGIYPMPIMLRLILWSVTRSWQKAQLS